MSSDIAWQFSTLKKIFAYGCQFILLLFSLAGIVAIVSVNDVWATKSRNNFHIVVNFLNDEMKIYDMHLLKISWTQGIRKGYCTCWRNFAENVVDVYYLKFNFIQLSHGVSFFKKWDK